MSILTKERLQQLADENTICKVSWDERIAMARQLLAGMAQEPVAYMHHSGQVVTREECCDDKTFAICCKVETPLYAAPQLPQPAVQNMHHDAKCDLFRPQVVNGVFVPRHCDCSAATLQGAETVRQTNKLPAACWCHTCRPLTMSDMRFVVCPECGNKRCPRANDCRNICTGSNEPGQQGSAYPAAPQEDRKSNVIGSYQGADGKDHPIINLSGPQQEVKP